MHLVCIKPTSRIGTNRVRSLEMIFCIATIKIEICEIEKQSHCEDGLLDAYDPTHCEELVISSIIFSNCLNFCNSGKLVVPR